MKTHIVIGLTFVLILIGFSGCVEQDTSGDNNRDTNGDTDKIELVNYNVYTYHYEGYGNYEKLSDGFKPNLENVDGYIVEGKIKNIAGEIIDVIITANFYDKNDSFLHSKTDYLYDIENSYTIDFEIYYGRNNKYFESVDNVKLGLEVV